MHWALTVYDGNNMKVHVHCAHYILHFCTQQTIHNAKVSKGLSAFSWKASAFPDWPSPSNPLRARLLANNKDGLTADAAIKNVTVERGALVTAERTPRAGPATSRAVFSSVPTDFLFRLLSCRLWLWFRATLRATHSVPDWRDGRGDCELVMRAGTACGISSRRLPLRGVPVSWRGCLLSCCRTLAWRSRRIDHYLAACDWGTVLKSLKRGCGSSHVSHHM